MRPIRQLVHSRTRVTLRYALMPLEGFPVSRLPTWPAAEVRVLASPRLGAEFVQMRIDLPAGKTGTFRTDKATETFFYVLGGSGAHKREKDDLSAGSFGLLPPSSTLDVVADRPLSLLVLHKRYEAAAGIDLFEPLFGHESKVKQEVWAGDDGALLQTLIPDDLKFDLAMNVFTFQPGHGLPIVETHVMEHGALILEGKGVYFLGDEWMEVEKDDFIWMGPYCPQSFYATGPTPAKYLYYKNVNRDIPL